MRPRISLRNYVHPSVGPWVRPYPLFYFCGSDLLRAIRSSQRFALSRQSQLSEQLFHRYSPSDAEKGFPGIFQSPTVKRNLVDEFRSEEEEEAEEERIGAGGGGSSGLAVEEMRVEDGHFRIV